MAEEKYPLISDLEKGPWPSFVKEIKMAAEHSPTAKDLLGVLERSYTEKIGHWKHGGIVGVMGYGGGVIGRYVDIPDDFPNISHFHTLRVNQPSGWFYTSKALRDICDIWEEEGSHLTNMHGSTGDIILLGTSTEHLEPTFEKLTEKGFDLGGSGSDVRTPSCCVGPARCEWACFDTLKRCYDLTMDYQDELHRPAFPYKWKFKLSGCPNDCVAAIARADISIIGTWKDDIQIDQAEVKKYVDNGLDMLNEILMLCPAKCMEWDGKELKVDNNYCRRCMHCINVMPKALRPGKERGATVLIGSKAPIVEGAQLSSVLFPFINLDDDEEYDEFKEIIEEMQDVWCEEGKNRERIGEFILRMGMGNFLDAVGLEPLPEMVDYPRDNPYIFFELDEDEEEDE